MLRLAMLLSALLSFSTTASASERIAGILYSVWHDHFQSSRDASGSPYVMSRGAPYGPFPTFNWWGEPLYSIYDYRFTYGGNPEAPNNALIDYHADLLKAAGIDFIAIDLTNGEQPAIVASAQAVAKRYSERPEGSSPQIVLFVQRRESVDALWPLFFTGRYADRIWFRHEGKPLLLIGQAGEISPRGGLLDYFTTRRTWGLQGSRDMWTFKLNTDQWRPGTAYYRNGQPEEMSVTAAVQASYMTTPNDGRKGRNGGAYFKEQWGYVMKTKPRVVFVTAWNEWGSQNFGNEWSPLFVDTFGQEYSADLEPMKGGHGDMYYRLLTGYVAAFKALP